MKDLKVYVPGGGSPSHYLKWLPGINVVQETNPKKADVLLFTGGADVDPVYYSEKKGSQTSLSYNSTRDNEEFNLLAQFWNDKKKIGICRGAQALCVAAGGKLIQHAMGHTGRIHLMETKDNLVFEVNSTHHQMMYPYPSMDESEYEILGWAVASSGGRISPTFLNGEDKEIDLPRNFVEPEIVYFPLTSSLAIQFHPESLQKGNTLEYLGHLALEYLDL